MQPLSLAYLESFRLCWSKEQLGEAADQWPSGNPTWSWFLGEHIAAMTRDEALLRILVGFAHMSRQGLFPTTRRGVALAWFRSCPDDQLKPAAAALGAWLDAPDETSLAPLEAFLATPANA